MLWIMPGPSLGNNVVVGAGATILGAIHIGDGARIGAGGVVIRDVPPGVTVVGVLGRISKGGAVKKIQVLEHGKLPDPIADALRFVLEEQDKLEERREKLESREGVPVELNKYFEKKRRDLMEELLPALEEFSEGGGI